MTLILGGSKVLKTRDVKAKIAELKAKGMPGYAEAQAAKKCVKKGFPFEEDGGRFIVLWRVGNNIVPLPLNYAHNCVSNFWPWGQLLSCFCCYPCVPLQQTCQDKLCTKICGAPNSEWCWGELSHNGEETKVPECFAEKGWTVERYQSFLLAAQDILRPVDTDIFSAMDRSSACDWYAGKSGYAQCKGHGAKEWNPIVVAQDRIKKLLKTKVSSSSSITLPEATSENCDTDSEPNNSDSGVKTQTWGDLVNVEARFHTYNEYNSDLLTSSRKNLVELRRTYLVVTPKDDAHDVYEQGRITEVAVAPPPRQQEMTAI